MIKAWVGENDEGKMKRSLLHGAIISLLILGLVVTSTALHRSPDWGQLDPYYHSLGESRQDLLVLFATLLNQRRLAADAYWVRLLVYTGSPEWSARRWPAVLPMTLSGTLLNPRFVPFYEYGSSILAWQLGRWQEALGLLLRGMKHNPGNEKLLLYAAAIKYQNLEEDDTRTIQCLSRIIFSGEYPGLLPPILANIYKQRGEYGKALKIWYFLMSQGLSGEGLERAKMQVEEIEALMNGVDSKQ